LDHRDRRRPALLQEIERAAPGRRDRRRLRRQIRRSEHARDQKARVLQRAEAAADHDVAAALERGRMRLLEDHVADAEQGGHHRDAEPEPAGQDRGSHRARRQRTQREPQDHEVTTRPLFIAR
jgi:hypothetical protein